MSDLAISLLQAAYNLPYNAALVADGAALPLACLAAGALLASLNVSSRRVGGLRFVKVGRLCLSFCISREYRPIGGGR